MFGLSPLLWVIIRYAVFCLAAFTAGMFLQHKISAEQIASLREADARASAAAIQQARNTQAESDRIARELAVQSAIEQQKTQDASNVVVRKVPVYVTSKPDSVGCVTYGLSVVFYAAVNQIDPDSISFAPGISPDACSTTDPADFAGRIVSSLGQAHLAINEVKAWRQWYEQQKSAWEQTQ